MKILVYLTAVIASLATMACDESTGSDNDIYLGEPVFKNDASITSDAGQISFDSAFTITTSITPKYKMKGIYGIRTLDGLTLLSPEGAAKADTSRRTTGMGFYTSGYFLDVDLEPNVKKIMQWKCVIPNSSKSDVNHLLKVGYPVEFFVIVDSIYIPEDTLRFPNSKKYFVGKRWYSTNYKIDSVGVNTMFSGFQPHTRDFRIPFKK